MADFLARVAERAIGQAPALQPVNVPVFVPVSFAANLPQDSSVASELAFEETQEQPTPAQVTPTMLPSERLVPNGPISKVEGRLPVDEIQPKAETQDQSEPGPVFHGGTPAASPDYDFGQGAGEPPGRASAQPRPLGREQEDTSLPGRRHLYNISEMAEVVPESEERPEVQGPEPRQRRPRAPASAPRQREPTTASRAQAVHTAPADDYAEVNEEINSAAPRVPRSPMRTSATTSRRQPEPLSATPFAQRGLALDSTADSNGPEEPPRVRTPQKISIETETEGAKGPPTRRLISSKEPQVPARVQTIREAPYTEEPATLSPAIPLTDGRAFDGPRSRPEAQPTVRVAIGRIEIRATVQTPPTAPTAAPRRRGPALPLADYLEQRREGKR